MLRDVPALRVWGLWSGVRYVGRLFCFHKFMEGSEESVLGGACQFPNTVHTFPLITLR